MNTFSLSLWPQALADLFVLNACLACHTPLVRQESHICLDCLGQIPLTGFEQNPASNEMFFRLAGRIPIQGAYSMAWFEKGGILQQLLESLKYANQPEIGQFLGKLYARQLIKKGYDFQAFTLVPVPLHPTKKRKRGYNQSEQICLGMQEELELPIMPDLLRRTRYTRTQTRMSGFRRQKNTDGAFELRGEVPDKILLVDDILTTGATMVACCAPVLEETEDYPEIHALSIGIAVN